MKLRRLAASAAAVASLSLVATPAASAQDLGTLLQGAGALDQVATSVLNGMDCGTYKTTIDALGRTTGKQLYTAETTRSQFAANLRGLSGDRKVSGVAALAAVKYSNQAADKAVSCKMVKEDSFDINSLSSRAKDFLPLIQQLSSK